jgi:hypothetical protein
VFVETGTFGDLRSALASIPWRPAFLGDQRRPNKNRLRLQLEVPPSDEKGQTRGDHPVHFWPPEAETSQYQQIPRHSARYVIEDWLRLDEIKAKEHRTDSFVFDPEPRESRGYYEHVKEGKSKLWLPFLRPWRLEFDQYLCAVTGLPADEVHHLKYRDDIKDDHVRSRDDATLKYHVEHELVSLSRLAHEAVTLLEYRHDVIERIDPLSSRWHGEVLKTIELILTTRERNPAKRRFVRNR